MKKKHLTAGKNKNMITCIGLGLLTAMIISVVLTLGLTSLVEKGKLSENGNFGVFLTRMIAVAAGGLVGAGLSDKKFLPIIIVTSSAYLIVLLAIGILLFDGSFHKMWLGVLSILIGAIIALLIKLKPQTNRKRAMRYTK